MQATLLGMFGDLVVVEMMTTFLAKTSQTKIMSFIFAFSKSIKLPPNHLFVLCLYEDSDVRARRLNRLRVEEELKSKVNANQVAPQKAKTETKSPA